MTPTAPVRQAGAIPPDRGRHLVISGIWTCLDV